MGSCIRPASDRSGPARLSDRELVVAYQDGDRAAYEEMYRRYSARVMSVCTRMLGNRQEAEEAAQETFLKAYQGLPKFNGQYQLGAWLARIASNVSLDRLRARARGATLVSLPTQDELLEVEQGPEELVVSGDERLEATMRELYPLHARALELRAVHGLSHEEMAGQLSMTPAQVKSLLHRARLSFRRAWQRAEGWAIAPLAALRSLIDERSRGVSLTYSNMGASIGSSVTPIMAERVMVSAVIVAAALTTLPAGFGSSQTDPIGVGKAGRKSVAMADARASDLGRRSTRAQQAAAMTARRDAPARKKQESPAQPAALPLDIEADHEPPDVPKPPKKPGGHWKPKPPRSDGIVAAAQAAVTKTTQDLLDKLPSEQDTP